MSIEMQINDVQAQELGLTSTDGLVLDVGEAVVIPGKNGVSPSIKIEPIPGGHRVTVTDAAGPQSFDVMDGVDSGDVDISLEFDETLKYDSEGRLGVNMATEVEDKTLPITAAAVHTTVGNIEVLLQTI